MSGHGSTIVREVISSTSSGADVMSALPGLVRQLLDEEAWREFTIPGTDEPVLHDSFTSFITAPPPRGLGGKAPALLALCGADEDLRKRVDRMLKGEIEAAEMHGANQHTSGHSTTVSRDTAGAVVARLKRDDPDLAERVVSGELSPYAAARQKGWKPPRIQVTTPERTAEHLRRHMEPEALAQLKELL